MTARVVVEIKLNPGGELLRLTDNGEGWLTASFFQPGDQAGIVVGIGRNRREALQSSQTTLQNALNAVDLAITREP